MSPDTPGDKPSMPEAWKAWRQTAMDGHTPKDDVELAAAALAKLKTATEQSVDSSEGDTTTSITTSVGRNSGASTSTAASTNNNRAARRQQACKREKAKKYEESEEESSEDEEDKTKQKHDDYGRDPFDYWGFLPGDYPLSDTDSEAQNPVKERHDRVLRSRKRQVKAHFTEAIDANSPPNWSELFAQARILETKWIDDDLTAARSQAKSKKTSLLKELPRQGWLSESHERLDAIQKKYANEVLTELDESGNVNAFGDQLKAMVLATAQLKEVMSVLPEALQAELDASRDEDERAGRTDRVLGFELFQGPDGVPCIGVKLPKNRGGEAQSGADSRFGSSSSRRKLI